MKEVVAKQMLEKALELTVNIPRELAVRFTDERRYFVSEATVYRLHKAHLRIQKQITHLEFAIHYT